MNRPGTPAWYDEQYNNRGRIPDHPSILQRWADCSAAAYAALEPRLDLRYGHGASETLDLFPPTAPNAPVLVYIHGGYWRALGKRDQAFVAPPFVRAGAMVVLLDYALCPTVSIEHIVMQTVRALAWVHRHAPSYGGDPDRIVVAGHSAGGHLAAMLLACRWAQVERGLPRRLVRAAISVSGIYDLEPLRHAPFLAGDIRLDAGSAARLSPALMPAPQGSLVAVVGGNESEEFLRQNTLIRQRWGERCVSVCEAIPGRHHMDVLDELVLPEARLHRVALRLLGLPRRS